LNKVKLNKDVEMIKKITTDLFKVDKFLAPVAFVYTDTENVILDLHEEFESEDTKTEFLPIFASKLFENKARRVIIVNEGEHWNIPAKMSQKKANKIIEDGLYKLYFNKQEAINFVEITRDKVNTYVQPFSRMKLKSGKESIKFKTIEEIKDSRSINYKQLQLALQLSH
jgi:hypothetical protein